MLPMLLPHELIIVRVLHQNADHPVHWDLPSAQPIRTSSRSTSCM